MRHPILLTLCAAAIGLSACEQSGEAEVERALQDMNVVDESNLNDVMLTVGDPDEAVRYFASASANDPGRIDLERGLAKSLVRAKRAPEAVAAWQVVVANEEATNTDRVDLADAFVRANKWDEAAATLNTIPPTFESFERYRIEAMVADSRQQWDKADSFYEIAAGLTTQPSNVMNNWGYSKMARGDYKAAEKLFIEAITYDRKLFTAKNNLVLARAAQKNYALPVIPMSEEEKAQLMYTSGLSAVKQGDTDIGRGLLQDAIDTHPRHFEEAVRSLESLNRTVKS